MKGIVEMKKKILSIVLSTVIAVTFIPTFAFAAEDVSDTNEDVKTEETENFDSKNVTIEYNELDKDSISTIPVKTLEKVEKSGGQIVVKSASSPIYYIIKNVRSASDYTGSDIATATGGPGVTLSISKTKSVSTTVSGTFGASNSAISSAVGWSVTGSTSISIQGSDTVPKKHSGKKVKKMTLHAKTVYKVKKYDVYKIIPGYIDSKQGTGTTKKAKGCTFTRTYTYK